MKINTSHLVGAAIVLAAVFFSKLDAQDAPAKAEPQKWEYFVVNVENSLIGPRGNVEVDELEYGGEDGKALFQFDGKFLDKSYLGAGPIKKPNRSMTKQQLLDNIGSHGWEFVCFEELPLEDHSRPKSSMTYHKDWIFRRPVQ